MVPLKLLINPLAEGAWFSDTVSVATAELLAHFPDTTVGIDIRPTLRFLDVDLPAAAGAELARLAFVQGVFEPMADGLRLIDADPGWTLPPELVWGAKYRGKTHELVTLMALQLARRHCRANPADRVLDPMAGRGTTLFWALRAGLHAVGVERDPRSFDDVIRHVKRQTKLHRIKHREEKGFVGPKRRDEVGRFLGYRFGDQTFKLVIGDSANLRNLLGPVRFPIIVVDVPYGIQHTGRGGTRNPTDLIVACAPAWSAALEAGGALAIVYNRRVTPREELMVAFEARGLTTLPFEAPHRMSESIIRDFLLFCRPLEDE